MRQQLTCLTAAIVLVLGCSTKRTAINTSPFPEDPRWARIDSLAGIGQYASALSMTEPLLAEARTNGDYQPHSGPPAPRPHRRALPAGDRSGGQHDHPCVRSACDNGGVPAERIAP
jgi:hypothetical protein